MQYRSLAKSGIKVSAVAMGCWAIAGDWVWGDQEERESIATVHAALELGVNFFDTAEGYGDGHSEVVLGRALAGRRHEAVIATKVSSSNLSRAGIREACEVSLRRLNTDTIDLYQIHWPSREVPIDESIEALEQLRKEGKVRAIGVCNFGTRDLSDLLAVGHCETNQLPYSLLWRAIEHGIQQQCIGESVGILCYSPLAQGLLTGKFRSADEVPDTRARTRHFSEDRPWVRHGEAGQEAEAFKAVDRIRAVCSRIDQPMTQVALAWVLAQPGVTSVLAGARHPGQVRENVLAADLTLSEQVLRELGEATDALKRALGPNPDQYQGESRFR